jgi:hypothetical protein
MKRKPPPCQHRRLITHEGKRICAACRKQIYV